MDDRVWVSVSVLNEHVDKAKELIAETEGDPSEEIRGDVFTELDYYEVNYGTIDALDTFKDHGIPYSMNSGAGYEFTEESKDLRFTAEGTVVHTREYKEWPSTILYQLQNALKEVGTLAGALHIIQETKDACIASNWDNQLEYSKLYLATQLINPPTK